MRLITRQDRANGAANEFAKIYRQYTFSLGFYWNMPSHEETYKELVALGKTPNPDDVDKILAGWTLSSCSACNTGVDTAVRVYDSGDDIEDHSVDLCLDCLKIASEIAETAR